MFTGLEDTDIYLLKTLNNEDLYNICNTDKYLHRLCCDIKVLKLNYLHYCASKIVSKMRKCTINLPQYREFITTHMELLPSDMANNINNIKDSEYKLTFYINHFEFIAYYGNHGAYAEFIDNMNDIIANYIFYYNDMTIDVHK